MGRGQLLSGVRRQQQDKGHGNKQDENTSPHGGTLLSPFAPCRRSGQRVAVPAPYIQISHTPQRFSGVACAYPELFAVVGARVPDYRGLFLRGHGSQTHSKNNGSTVGVTSTTHSSGALNQIQGDGTRNITGDIGWTKNGGNGAIEYVSSQPEFDLRNGSGWYLARLNTSRVVPTANENRPVNMAVRYLIRALP